MLEVAYCAIGRLSADGESAADAAHSAGCSGQEDRGVVFMFRRHVAHLGLRSKTNWRRGTLAGTNDRRHPPCGYRRVLAHNILPPTPGPRLNSAPPGPSLFQNP
jgi:hypothetical protein